MQAQLLRHTFRMRIGPLLHFLKQLRLAFSFLLPRFHLMLCLVIAAWSETQPSLLDREMCHTVFVENRTQESDPFPPPTLTNGGYFAPQPHRHTLLLFLSHTQDPGCAFAQLLPTVEVASCILASSLLSSLSLPLSIVNISFIVSTTIHVSSCSVLVLTDHPS